VRPDAQAEAGHLCSQTNGKRKEKQMFKNEWQKKKQMFNNCY
jgi:hypothetical protein